jgi:hypothetical protein
MENLIQDLKTALSINLSAIKEINFIIDNETNIISIKQNNKLLAEITISYSSERNCYYSFLPNNDYKRGLHSYTSFIKENFIYTITNQFLSETVRKELSKFNN